MTGARREPGRTVTSKVVGILQVFSPDEHQLSLHQISVRVGLPPSTALRLIRELTAAGVLERTPTGDYCIGLGLWQAGELSVRARRLRESAGPAMLALHMSLRAGIQLAIHKGDEVVVIDKLVPPGTAEAWPSVAGALPLHATAAGKLLLAALPAAARVRLLRRTLPRFTPRTIVAPGLLLSGLDSVARQGIAVNTEETLLGWSAVAAYIRTPDGTAAASIAAAVRSSGFDRDRMAGHVRRAAEATASRLAALGAF